MIKTQKLGLRKSQSYSDRIIEGRWRTKGIILTIAQYNELTETQDHACAICKGNEDVFLRGLFVDHDHMNGKIRGLLCVNCNALLAHAKDSVGILEAAIEYLLKDIGYRHNEGHSL